MNYYKGYSYYTQKQLEEDIERDERECQVYTDRINRIMDTMLSYLYKEDREYVLHGVKPKESAEQLESIQIPLITQITTLRA